MQAKEETARQICAMLTSHGYRALFAGGCVRDLLLHVESKDFDIATSAHAFDVLALFPRTVAVGAAFGVVKVVEAGYEFEVATFRRDGPYLDGRHPSHVEFTGEREDALRRDFTINALFLDPATNEILDYVDGRADIAAGAVRTVGDPHARFQEDHLRLLRAIRFAARLRFEIAPETWNAICARAPLINNTSAERVRDEILKMLTEGNAATAFRLMDQSGLLREVLPEIAAMKGIEQPEAFHPEGDVFVHTMLALEKLRTDSHTLALGMLLHDVGKPPTQTFEDRIRFNEHDKVGAEMAEQICRRLRMSNEQTERVRWLVAQHMRVAAIPEMRESKRKRFVREPGFDELLELCRIDCLASHADTSFVDWVDDYRRSLKPETIRPAPLINGRDLIQLGLAPGPIFKEIISAVEDAQLENVLATHAEALAYVTARWGHRHTGGDCFVEDSSQ